MERAVAVPGGIENDQFHHQDGREGQPKHRPLGRVGDEPEIVDIPEGKPVDGRKDRGVYQKRCERTPTQSLWDQAFRHEVTLLCLGPRCETTRGNGTQSK